MQDRQHRRARVQVRRGRRRRARRAIKGTPVAEVGYIPGRGFVGRVLECGWDVGEEVVRKGEWVVGLLDVRKVRKACSGFGSAPCCGDAVAQIRVCRLSFARARLAAARSSCFWVE